MPRTRIPNEILQNVVKQAGLEVEELKNFYAARAGGRSIYFTKRPMCSRVDLSGFMVRHPSVKPVPAEVAKERRIGRVQAQVDFTQGDPLLALEAFRTALEYMKFLAQEDELDKKIEAGEAKKRKKPLDLEALEQRAVRAARKPVPGIDVSVLLPRRADESTQPVA